MPPQTLAEIEESPMQLGIRPMRRFFIGFTPPKLNMEPENDGFQKESPFPGTSFHVKISGVYGKWIQISRTPWIHLHRILWSLVRTDAIFAGLPRRRNTFHSNPAQFHPPTNAAMCGVLFVFLACRNTFGEGFCPL